MITKRKSAKWFVKRMWILCIFSIAYLYLRNYTTIYIKGLMFENFGWSTGENCFASFYPAMIVAVTICILGKMKFFVLLYWGRITYYIFLFQILWFAVAIRFLPPNVEVRTIITFPMCFAGGYVLYKVSAITVKYIPAYGQK